MTDIILGFIFIVLGLVCIVSGIDSRIPKTIKGYHLLYAQDGYRISKAKFNGAKLNDGKDAYVLVMEETND